MKIVFPGAILFVLPDVCRSTARNQIHSRPLRVCGFPPVSDACFSDPRASINCITEGYFTRRRVVFSLFWQITANHLDSGFFFIRRKHVLSLLSVLIEFSFYSCDVEDSQPPPPELRGRPFDPVLPTHSDVDRFGTHLRHQQVRTGQDVPVSISKSNAFQLEFPKS
jgi:hypothetical protein